MKTDKEKINALRKLLRQVQLLIELQESEIYILEIIKKGLKNDK